MSVSVAVQLPGRKVISVPLNTDSTAADVIYQCKRSGNLSDEYFLTADFDGFDKLFEPEERLYHLVKKHVVASGRQKDVQFFLRKKKANAKGKLLSDSVSSLSLDSQSEEMAVGLRSTTSDYGELRALSTAQLRQIAMQRRNTIEENYAKISEKNQRLHGLLKCSGIDLKLHKTIRQIKERLAVEEARYRQLAKLKDELATYTLCYQSLIHQLEQVNAKIESKQFALEHCDRSIEELGRLLAKVKLQRVLLSKKAEISLLDNEIRELSPTVTQQQPPCPPLSNQERPANKCTAVERPRAAVEPFKAEPANLAEKEEPALTDYVKSKGFQEAYSAVEEVLSSDLTESVPAEKSNSPEVNRDVGNAKLPTDVAQISPYKVNVSINRRFQMASTKFDNTGHSPPPDLIPASEKTKFLCHSQTAALSSASTEAADETVDSAVPTGSGEFVKVEPDRMYVRSDTLRAAKRRSWADHHVGTHCSTNDETEHIRLLLCRELKKGKTSVNLSWILDQLNGVNNTDAKNPADLKRLGDHVTTEEAKDKSPCSDTSPPEEMSRKAVDVCMSGKCSSPPLSSAVLLPNCDGHMKSILMHGSKSSRSEVKKSVRFDPLALLLDAALEGELDLVKRCSKEVPNVSVCYEEGITALHNAICAGHYEVVRFLVEAGADVNAQDSDGWTPLHCAASCNNLPIVKFLVEHGACIFATTLSDQETPADKCEESEEGFIGCSQFLVSLQERMGVINSGRVYAGCNYDKQREDEISFKLDDELRVLSKETEEKNWWWVVHLATGQEGYVPRNFLSLYPRLTRNCYLKCTFNDSEASHCDSQ
uniref:SH3 domain-containing protein n=1 Tax=Trichuris muris TaxID=70415 RepID=A0A5S6QP16_TRIMR